MAAALAASIMTTTNTVVVADKTATVAAVVMSITIFAALTTDATVQLIAVASFNTVTSLAVLVILIVEPMALAV